MKIIELKVVGLPTNFVFNIALNRTKNFFQYIGIRPILKK